MTDGLVAIGCALWDGNPLVLFDAPPDNVKQYVADDVFGVSTPCLILV